MKVLDVSFEEPKDFRVIIKGLMPKLIDYFGRRDVLMVDLALTECVNNAWEHGNRMAPDKAVHLTITVSKKRVLFRIKDEGEGFPHDLSSKQETNTESDRGRGLFIIQQVMDHTIPSDKGNQFLLVKNRIDV
ncbi:ATP-binding protein [Salisediminibacterium selenitireducens]|uniref:Anti-sigma regulatory factor, serine/threonine protein kinase n=1 Tax=Bacillus selenitireducens (strain ATCC 700615 / DSM 15326 / MLS10) TaxID=439292 RepID=D6Y146_BACIE|nr:ATP-binding protein [Salisediminibacterium selenitireducens]ADH98650.1 putative anti-sigma regulatory factor, serine/threonine protein kinase [[Bacillus] selenitireducens MLS10]